jgi:hypothetical protein
MSFAPQTLLDARAYLQPRTGLPWVSLGIVGGAAHKGGYHCGRDRLIPDDYSARLARDRAGLTDAASALDIGWFSRLVALTAHMVGEARAGRLPDVRELIGPWSDGRAYRWDHQAGWSAVRRPAGDSHETHLHISYYRDSERREKITPFRRFFEPQEDDVSWTEKLTLPGWVVEAFGDQDGLVSAAGALTSAYGHARSANVKADRIAVEQAAILAKLAGDDTVAAVRAELDRHRTESLAVLVPAVVTAVRAELDAHPDGVTDERLVVAAEAGVRAALGELDNKP